MGRSTRSSGQSEQGQAPTYLMRAAKQPFGRLLAVERTSVREGTDDAPQQQKLEHEAGHLDQGRGGLSGTGYSGFARLNAARDRSISRADCGKPFFSCCT